MGIIPPPVNPPKSGAGCSIVLILGTVMVLLVFVGVAIVAVTGYRQLEQPPEAVSAITARVEATLEAQRDAMAVYQSAAESAMGPDFNFARALRRWHAGGNEELRGLMHALLVNPAGLSDSQRIIFTNLAREDDEWPESMDPGRHALGDLIQNASQVLAEDEEWSALRAAVRHHLAWRALDPREADEANEYSEYEAAVRALGVGLALEGVAAARRGDRALAWDHILLIAELRRQWMREPHMHSMRGAIENEFHADIVLWSLLDHGPLAGEEMEHWQAIAAMRADAAPLHAALEIEAALAPAREPAEGAFPLVGRRVAFDQFWASQQAIIEALETAPREVSESLSEMYWEVPYYAQESNERIAHNLYVYRIHWQSRFAWELATLAAALKAFKAERGAYPAMLDELGAAGFAVSVPEDPIWGESIRYARLDDGFALYMVRVEDYYWLHEDSWTREYLNDWEEDYGLTWEIVWRALR